LAIDHCQSACAATCGRWVTHSTWRLCAQFAQHAADDLGDATADADIDFVEDQRAGRHWPGWR
jgi:hypothetical protein